MNARQRQLNDLVNNAVNAFNENEEYLISHDLSERCICSKFAMHLENEFRNSIFRSEGYIVDVEYNRGARGNEYLPKELDGRRIVVDLIIHKRGRDEIHGFQNLVCIEMKKSNDRRGTDDDKKRLRAMTLNDGRFGYEIGFMIIADMRENRLRIDETFFKEW